MIKKNHIRRIVGVAVFLLVLVICILGANYAYWHVSITKSEEYGQETSYTQFLSKGAKHLDYAFFGASHPMVGLNSEYIPNSFNFGTVGENPIITYYKVRRVLEWDHVEVSTIVLPLDPQTFSSFFLDKAHQFPFMWLTPRYITIEELASFKNDSTTRLWLDAYLPFLGNGKMLMGDLFV